MNPVYIYGNSSKGMDYIQFFLAAINTLNAHSLSCPLLNLLKNKLLEIKKDVRYTPFVPTLNPIDDDYYTQLY